MVNISSRWVELRRFSQEKAWIMAKINRLQVQHSTTKAKGAKEEERVKQKSLKIARALK